MVNRRFHNNSSSAVTSLLLHILIVCLSAPATSSSCFISLSNRENYKTGLLQSNIQQSFLAENIDFDNIVESRYACTRFHRNDGTVSNNINNKSKPTASISNPDIVKIALQCLNLSRRAPSGFNAQPYRLLIVNEKDKKEEVSKYCLGRNADRVRDSDCTILFLADKECLREYKRFGKFLDEPESSGDGDNKKSLSPWLKRKMQFFILLFSSGWPLPRFLSNPISFCMRLGVSTVSVITRRRILVPSLGSAETWAAKNTMLVAMTYMLACSSRGLVSCPMEGFNAGGLRKALGIPRRFAIPLIVSTGLAYKREREEEGFDDVGMEHGPKSESRKSGSTRRYPMEEVIFANEFGKGYL